MKNCFLHALVFENAVLASAVEAAAIPATRVVAN